ncbi:MAG TPA: histidine kinase [Gemmatimonadaceae bacterium]|nr:histidine kinase [Gemmatimonadaceae bacterium]
MSTDSTRSRRQVRLAALAVATAVGLLFFGYYYLDDVVRGHATPWLEPFIEEMTGSYGAVILVPWMVWVARRFPLRRHTWLRSLPAHIGGVILFSIAHTSLNWLSRALIFPLAGLGTYRYGRMPLRYAMEFPNDVLVWALVVAGVYAVDHIRAARDADVRAARLETQLARTQLENLRLRLQPHFLFNALNTISSVMYDDPRAADRMLGQLAELLRLSLRGADAQEVTLGEEVAFLERYLDIMRARFEERLAVRLEVPDDARAALVPSLLLQPLVENAIRHGNTSRTGAGRVEVLARRDDGALVVEVADDGPGLAVSADEALAKGLGLSSTVARLRQLYGDRQAVALRNDRDGGLRVTVRLPFHTVPAAAR